MLTEVYAFYADPPCWKDRKHSCPLKKSELSRL